MLVFLAQHTGQVKSAFPGTSKHQEMSRLSPLQAFINSLNLHTNEPLTKPPAYLLCHGNHHQPESFKITENQHLHLKVIQ